MEPKLSFCRSVDKEMKPFLTLYQTDKPMMPFLSADLYDLLKTLMTRVLNVVTTIMNAAKLCGVNVYDVDNQQHYKKVDVGFSVERILKNLKEDKKISKQHEIELTAEGHSSSCQVCRYVCCSGRRKE